MNNTSEVQDEDARREDQPGVLTDFKAPDGTDLWRQVGLGSI